MNVAGQLVAIAAAEVGVREVGNNAGARVNEYMRASNMKPGEWAWCAAFVAWCVREWLCVPEVLAALNLPKGLPAEEWRGQSPGAYKWEEWARKRGLQVLDERDTLQPGDLVTFDFSHIGIVEADEGAVIATIEGNTNADGEREGDGVYRKRRARALIRRAIRIIRTAP